MDLKPDILIPAPDDDRELVFQAEQENATVVAQDPEGESMLFVWEVPHGVLDHFEQDNGAQTVSIATIPNDPILDGGTLTCTVIDTYGNTVAIEWQMVVE